MVTVAETAAAPTPKADQKRKQRRKALNNSTFIKRLTMEEGSILCVTILERQPGDLVRMRVPAQWLITQA